MGGYLPGLPPRSDLPGLRSLRTARCAVKPALVPLRVSWAHWVLLCLQEDRMQGLAANMHHPASDVSGEARGSMQADREGQHAETREGLSMCSCPGYWSRAWC